MVLENILYVYASFFVLLLLHELAKAPESLSVSFKYLVIPVFKTSNQKFVYGHLITDFLVLMAVWHYQPENIIFQLFGLVAWTHLILSLVLGSLVPSVNSKKNLFPNPENNDFFLALPLALLVFALQSNYYLDIIKLLL